MHEIERGHYGTRYFLILYWYCFRLYELDTGEDVKDLCTLFICNVLDLTQNNPIGQNH